MKRLKGRRRDVGILLMGILCLTACAPPYETAQRRTAYSRYPAPKEALQVMDTLPYLSPFMDILIPGELSERWNHTTLIETRHGKVGISVYTGRVSKTAMDLFFRGDLKRHGWDLITAFSSRPATILLFNRKSRWCAITLDERGPATDVRVAVSQDLGLAPRLLGY